MKYPIGIQSFDQIIEGNWVYVDKTDLVYRLVTTTKTCFLSRPRRFGKSLLVSTLDAYFKGRKELFDGLMIAKLEKDWHQYPVFKIDFNGVNFTEKGNLEATIEYYLANWEKIYGETPREVPMGKRFEQILSLAYQQTGRRAVVLVDEYDKPILDALDTPLEDANREILKAFYSTFKGADEYLRFVLLTGVTKFSQVSVFSGFNQPKDISMDNHYEALCGVTQVELEHYFAEPIANLAEKFNYTVEEMKDVLKMQYDGYHFGSGLLGVYNPFSLLTAMAKGKIGSYWFGSSTPTYLIEMLNKFHVKPQQIGGRKVLAESFDAPTERMTDINPLLYQSGYVTIKNQDSFTGLYTLDIPNKEVRIGLMKSLLSGYLNQYTAEGFTTVALLFKAITEERIDDALRLLQTFLSTIPQCDNTDYEGHYQSLLYTIFSLLGMYVDVEVRTPDGRVDMVMRTPSILYVIELKLNKTADIAMQQIDLKNYPERFALCGLPIVKVAINFDSKRHTLEDWIIS